MRQGFFNTIMQGELQDSLGCSNQGIYLPQKQLDIARL